MIWLLKSLKAQTIQYEMITIDSARQGFQSAAQALNLVEIKQRGNILCLSIKM